MDRVLDAMVFEMYATGEETDAAVQAAGSARYAAILGEAQ